MGWPSHDRRRAEAIVRLLTNTESGLDRLPLLVLAHDPSMIREPRLEERARTAVLPWALGKYPDLSVADANQTLADAKAKLANNIDPGEIAIANKRAVREAETFNELVNLWIERWAKRNRKRWEEAKLTLEYDAIPTFGNRKVRKQRPDFLILPSGLSQEHRLMDEAKYDELCSLGRLQRGVQK